MYNLEVHRARWIRVRMGMLCALLFAGLCSIVASAYNIQVKHGSEWRQIAEKQRQRKLKIQPMRGSIYDRNGEPLAVSVDVPSVAVNVVEMIRGVPEIRVNQLIEMNAVRLAQALNLPVLDVQNRLRTRRRFVWVKRHLSQHEASSLRALMDVRSQNPMKGILIEGEGHRFYPGRESVWGLIGYVSSDGVGIDGIEKTFDEELRGHQEQISALRDRKGSLLFGNRIEDERALAGNDLHLTLDLGLQFQVFEDLEAGMRAVEAKSASAVVLDPNTGEILAMASVPAFNPNDYADSPIEERRHHAMFDRYEPGSTMKVFTLAAALSEGKIKPTDTLFCENGYWEINGKIIRDTHPAGDSTPSEILAKSSNICAAKIGTLLGEAKLYSAFKQFGFGESTGLGLPGEASGVLRPRGRPWFDIEVAYASFGQGISVTNLQMAYAMATIANGGRLLEPLLVKNIISPTHTVVREEVPIVRREVISTHVARIVAEMMTGVVEEDGTGLEASVAGYRVAGKTSTAQKASSASGYSGGKFVASFVGFVPVHKPRFVIAVTVDEPVVAHSGGQVAGPIFRRIAMHALARFGVAPSNAFAKAPISVPLEDPTPRAYARSIPSASQETALPIPSTQTGTKSDIVAPIALASGVPPVGYTVVPNLIGWPARDAIRALNSIGLSVQLDGTGLIWQQEPVSSTLVAKKSVVKLRLKPEK